MTTIPWGIPPINHIPNKSCLCLGSNQSYGILPSQGGNPPWNVSQVKGQYSWNVQIPIKYQPCSSPHPQGRNSPFNTVPPWNGKSLGNNQYFWGITFQGRSPPWNVN